MYSHRSQLLKQAYSFHNEFVAALPNSFTRHHLPAEIDGAFFEYFKTLAFLLEKRKNERTLGQFDQAQKELLYTLIAHLNAGFFDKDLTDTQVKELEEMLTSFLQRQEQGFTSRKKLVVLTIKAGHGHTSAAKAVVAGMYEQYGHDIEVVLRDLQVDLNSFYESTVKHTPKVYKWLFDASNSAEGMSLVNSFGYPMFAEKLDTMLKEEDPDMLVSTYSFPGINAWIEKSLQKYRKKVPFVTVITDSISIHQMWYAKSMDYYVVSNEETKASVIEKGFSKDKVKVLGFPVHPKFYRDLDVAAQRAKRGVSTDKLVFLAIVGTGSTMKDVEYVREFHKKFGKEAELVVIFGNNTSMLNKLRKEDLGESVKLFGWVDDMYRFMKFSDAVITKAGGATVMECIASQKPMIITKVLPGQEQGNAELIEKYGLGIVCGKKDTVTAAITSFMKKKSDFEGLSEKFETASVKNGTFEICKFLVSLVKK